MVVSFSGINIEDSRQIQITGGRVLSSAGQIHLLFRLSSKRFFTGLRFMNRLQGGVPENLNMG